MAKEVPMYRTIKRPSEEQCILFEAIDRELKKKAGNILSDTERVLMAAEFVQNYDFANSALAHKSAGGWANLILSELV